MGAQRSRGLLATSEGARLLDKRRRDKHLTLEQVAEQSGVSIDVVGKLFHPHRGKLTDRSKIEQIARVLELEPKEFIDPDEWVPPVKDKKKAGLGSIEWHSVFLARLAGQEKQRLLRQAATEQGFELNVFVPLGLAERKQQPRSQKSPQTLEQETIVKRYEHDEFLRQVIGLGTTGKHIAIIGEPGAGKTTILSKVAQFIRNEEKASPIYISLGGLKGKSLSEFLLEEWLPEALAAVDADCTEVEQKQFEKFLRGGDVWLLLDGVDEIANLTPLKALAEVRSLPLDWQVRVVVTCRSNVWDASLNNGMQGFETYRTQEFADKDVEKFIQDWFVQAGHLERGEKLIEKLREPRREAIFRLVRSPLRLALLCQVVYRNPDTDLPETKAGLYEQFANYFYEWKPNITDIDWVTSLTLKQALHEALGRLALAGLDSDHRFRLPLSLIQQTMGDELFRLAWEVGWLNVVDRDLEGDDPIYSFFHPTFQEFFAASVILNWDYFMPSNNAKSLREKRFRIFEQNWREVLPLWIGLQRKGEIENLKKVIKMILDFEDGIDRFQFYMIRIRLMLLDCLSEIEGCIIVNDFTSECFDGLGEISPSIINRHSFSDPLLEMELLVTQKPLDKSSRKVLHGFHANEFRRLFLNRQKCIDDEMCLAICDELEEQLPKCDFCQMIGKEEMKYSFILRDIEDLDFNLSSGETENRIYELLRVSSTMASPMIWERAIKILSRLNYEYTVWLLESWAENSIENQSKHRYYSIVLAEIADEDGDMHYFGVFRKVISGEDLEEAIWALERLCRIANLKQSAIKFHSLIDLLCQFAIKYSSVKFIGNSHSICEDCFPSELAVQCLGKIGLPESIIEQTLRQLFWKTSEISIHCEIANVFIKLGFSTKEFWLELAGYFNRSEDWCLKTKIAVMLADAEADIPDLDEGLLNLVLDGLDGFSGEAEDLHDAVLKYCSPKMIIQKLKPWLSLEDQQQYPYFFDFCYKLLRDLARRVDYPVFYTLWHAEVQDSLFFGDFFVERLNRYLSNSGDDIENELFMIKVDSNQFSNPKNPTQDIYIEMLDQGCPEATTRRPTTLTHLKTYWRLDLKSLDKTPALIIYNSQNPSQPFNEIFLQTLSTFGGLICVITDQPQPNLQTFCPNQPELAQSIAKWLERSILEA